jgi:prepilin-type N-terminal cleavage/methylation domain-containing protein
MNKKGVTLMELIVVFVIIAIAAGLIAPSIGSWLPRYRLRSATRDIVSTLRDAQMKAVSNRMLYQIDFTADSYILRHTSAGVLLDDWPARRIPSGITVNNDFPLNTAAFNFDSTCPSGGTVTLSYQKGGVTQAQKRIVLYAATGRVRIDE